MSSTATRPIADAPAAHAGAQPTIDLSDITRRYDLGRGATRTALDNVSLRIERGAWAALLGPNGSGKSTLLRIIATLDIPDEGRVMVLGENAVTSPRAVRARMGVVFQQPGLDPILTVRENLLGQAALFGIPRAEARQRVEALADELGVADRLHDRVGRLSGGLARRVDLARALLPRPELLLLDEPTSGLDHDARSAFLETLTQRRDAGGLTIVMSTHLMDEAERADVVAMLDRGRLVQHGAPDDLRNRLGGEHVLRAAAEHGGVLERAGLRTIVHLGRCAGSGDAEAVANAAAELARDGAAFDVGPPTLGDVYLEATGRDLAGEQPEEPAS